MRASESERSPWEWDFFTGSSLPQLAPALSLVFISLLCACVVGGGGGGGGPRPFTNCSFWGTLPSRCGLGSKREREREGGREREREKITGGMVT